MLELIQQKYMTIITGEGRNNFILEFNENREPDEDEEGRAAPSIESL